MGALIFEADSFNAGSNLDHVQHLQLIRLLLLSMQEVYNVIRHPNSKVLFTNSRYAPVYALLHEPEDASTPTNRYSNGMCLGMPS